MSIINNLISYWKFDDASGINVSDSTSTFNGTWNGTLGSQWTTGKIIGGGLFNGTDNFVSMGNVLDQDGTTPFSISLWFKTSAGGATVYSILDKCLLSGSFAGYQMGLNVVSGGAPDAGKIGVVMVDAATTVSRRQSTTTYNDGNWHHFVYTYDGTKTRAGMLMYIDGSQPTYSDSDSASWSGSNSNSINFEIGARDGSGQLFPGSVDEVGFWNRVLNQTEVTQLYNQGNGLSWPFEILANNKPHYYLKQGFQ